MKLLLEQHTGSIRMDQVFPVKDSRYPMREGLMKRCVRLPRQERRGKPFLSLSLSFAGNKKLMDVLGRYGPGSHQ